MSRYWSSLLQGLKPYVPGEQRSGSGVIKLNTNENPYPPGESVLRAIASVDGQSMRRYPTPNSGELLEALARYHGLQTEQVFLGNGSDEVLALAFMAFFKQARPLVFPAISYSFYPVYCQLFEIPHVELPMTQGFDIDWSALPDDIGGIVFPNPNAPTGIACSLESIEQLLRENESKLVLIDEAYIDFGAESAIALIDRNPNLLVTQTFSKGRSLAGLRVGAAFGQADLIEGLNRVKNSFNSYPLDVIAEQAAVASIADEAHYTDCVSKIVKSRLWLTEQLQSLGFDVLPSSANFIFASPTKVAAGRLHDELNAMNILVRYWDKPMLKDWLRISIGTEAELATLIKAIVDIQQSPEGDTH